MKCWKAEYQLGLIKMHRDNIKNARYELGCYVRLYNEEIASLKAIKEIYLLVCRESWDKEDVKAIYEPVHVLYEDYKKRVRECGEHIKFLKQYIKKNQRCISRMDLLK